MTALIVIFYILRNNNFIPFYSKIGKYLHLKSFRAEEEGIKCFLHLAGRLRLDRVRGSEGEFSLRERFLRERFLSESSLRERSLSKRSLRERSHQRNM